ncbi:MAG: PQQ-binding-like beta-propeller repeat protein [Spirochaetes bacterium]|nr:PQQ-binding-like beta-propeller repeat protein [Spirochaetota bacterium]
MRALIVSMIIGIAASLSAADWPQFFGPDRTGISPETGINKNWNTNPPKQLWKLSMSDDGYAGPSAADGMVFIIDRNDANDVVKALDAATGKELWSYQYPDPGSANYGYARSTPTCDAGKLYTLSRSGLLNCLDAKSGKLLWSVKVIKSFGGKLPQWLLALSPFIDGDAVIVCPGGSENPVAIDKNTGATLWKGNCADAVSYATPVVTTLAGKRQYLLFMAKNLIGADAANGQELWRVPWETKYDVNAALPLPIGDDRVFISSGYNHGCGMVKVSDDGAKLLWENKSAMAHFSSPILYKGFIYANSDPDNLVCIDPASGTAKWKSRGFEKGGFIIVDDVIIAVGGRTGDVVMASAVSTSYKEIGRMPAPLGGQSWTAPIVADKKLYIRNKIEIACYSLE